MFDKKAFFEEVVRQFTVKIATTEEMMGLLNTAVSESPGAMQSHSDTSKFQNSIIASEQDKSLQDKKAALNDIRFFLSGMIVEAHDSIAMGSAFCLRDRDDLSYFVVLPNGGGERIEFAGNKYCVTTPNSPLFHKAFRKRKGDKLLLGQGNKTRMVEIDQVD